MPLPSLIYMLINIYLYYLELIELNMLRLSSRLFTIPNFTFYDDVTIFLNSTIMCSVAQLHPTPCDAHQALLSMEYSRQEYWSELPFPSPGDLPTTGTETASPVSLALAGRFFISEPPGKTHFLKNTYV